MGLNTLPSFEELKAYVVTENANFMPIAVSVTMLLWHALFLTHELHAGSVPRLLYVLP